MNWNVGDDIQVEANQGTRDGVIIAIIGNEMLVEYEMPAGRTFLICGDEDKIIEPYVRRNYSYKNIPNKWVKAAYAQAVSAGHDVGAIWKGQLIDNETLKRLRNAEERGYINDIQKVWLENAFAPQPDVLLKQRSDKKKGGK